MARLRSTLFHVAYALTPVVAILLAGDPGRRWS